MAAWDEIQTLMSLWICVFMSYSYMCVHVYVCAYLEKPYLQPATSNHNLIHYTQFHRAAKSNCYKQALQSG